MEKKRSKGKRYWFTYAFFTREGQPAEEYRTKNFTHSHDQLSRLLSDLKSFMKREQERHSDLSPGAYVAAVWAGQLDAWAALKSEAMPLYYVYPTHLEKL